MRKPVREPWHPAEWTDEDALAIKAVALGNASEGQQRTALDWILKAAMVGDQSFVPMPKGDPNGRIDAFLEGRRSVGNQILKLIKVKLEKLNE